MRPRAVPAGLPARVMEIVDEHIAQLGFTAVTREALSNCARH